MFILLRKILKKSKTYQISEKKFIPEKSNVIPVTLKIVDDMTPSIYSMNEEKPNKLKRQCTSVKDLDEILAKLRKTKSSTPTYHRYTFSTPPQIYQTTNEHPAEYSATASSTVSEEDEEEYSPVVMKRKSNMIRRINSSKQRFSSPPIKNSEIAESIDKCYSQNSNRFQFRLSQNFLPSIPIEEDALSLIETTSLPFPMEPILNCYH